MSTLANTIAGLHQQIQTNEICASEAWDIQMASFERGQRVTAAAVRALPVSEPVFNPQQSLSSVALAHKDIFDRDGSAPGLGRDQGHADASRRTAPVLDALTRAGALDLATLTLAEDACAATGQTRGLPTPINPLDESLAVGGSSSGSAVAVAAGMVYGSLGTDTAGSVRIPAMTCGVMGLKTTHALIDRTGMAALSPSLDSIGVLARSTLDLAAILKVLAPQLVWQASEPLRLGYWLEGTQLAAEVYQVIEPVMHRFASQHIDLSAHEARATAMQELMMAHEVGLTHQQRMAHGLACPQVMSLGSFGLTIPSAWWRQALADRQQHLQGFMDLVFGQFDVLLAPLQVQALPQASSVYLGEPNFETSKLLALHRYCGWLNYLGLPALAMPVGRDSRGLPVSLQLIGKPFGEPQLLALGRRIEREIHGEHGIEPVLKL